jgi:outer membrane protein assembly factor BamB
MTRKLTACVLAAIPASFLLLWASDAREDWPMWGGTPDRNMVSHMKGVPTTWDVKTKKNVKWMVELGSQSYGNAVVAGGTVFVGTNNESLKDPKVTGDKGILMAFRESDGEFLWQDVNDKLPSGRANDWPFQGVCSSPLVEGDRLYYVTNRCEVRCLDTKGDGNKHGKVIWKYDMMDELGSQPHNMSNSSPVSFGDLIFVSTSNGQDESHVHIPSPRSPAIIAINKQTGKLVWEDNSVNDRILHGQWSSAAVGKIGGVDQVVIGQGDGWARGYEALTGKKLWEFDMKSAATSPRRVASGITIKFAGRFPLARFSKACSTTPISAAFCIASM